ncbi:hypothetical protein C2E25_08290 [Geothermobacter hydrogeniphilus]|uniref:Uncharacterized protein n=1 Tax=Geothermobacter hydrogeniphilus TaxID=1969733 RepID=A0A2K2HAE8_9BACT|nr:hypothetical protein C2E25_08290 [Geothermobacter hydrogeniphilus]
MSQKMVNMTFLLLRHFLLRPRKKTKKLILGYIPVQIRLHGFMVMVLKNLVGMLDIEKIGGDSPIGMENKRSLRFRGIVVIFIFGKDLFRIWPTLIGGMTQLVMSP